MRWEGFLEVLREVYLPSNETMCTYIYMLDSLRSAEDYKTARALSRVRIT